MPTIQIEPSKARSALAFPKEALDGVLWWIGADGGYKTGRAVRNPLHPQSAMRGESDIAFWLISPTFDPQAVTWVPIDRLFIVPKRSEWEGEYVRRWRAPGNAEVRGNDSSE